MIHPTAIIDPRARLGANVAVGPYTIIGGDVEIGDGTVIGSHNVITGWTRIGAGNRIFHFCSIGEENQDKKYKGEPTRLEIGDGNVIREYCSLNRGTAHGGGLTRVGDDNWFMAYCHVAHDCEVGSHVVFANNATLGGHVHVGDWTVLGGFVGIHQFVRIGAHVMAGVSSVILQDVPPYVLVAGHPCAPHGINARGLKRRGFSDAQVAAIKRAYRALYRSGLGLSEARAELAKMAATEPAVAPMAQFLEASERGLLR